MLAINGTHFRKQQKAFDRAETVDYLFTKVCPDAENVTLILDNLNVPAIESMHKRFSEEKADALAARLDLVKTPVHGSWINAAEIQIFIIFQQCLVNRIPDLKTLQNIKRAWTRKRNVINHTINWQFTAADARVKLRRLYPEDQGQEAT